MLNAHKRKFYPFHFPFWSRPLWNWPIKLQHSTPHHFISTNQITKFGLVIFAGNLKFRWRDIWIWEVSGSSGVSVILDRPIRSRHFELVEIMAGNLNYDVCGCVGVCVCGEHVCKTHSVLVFKTWNDQHLNVVTILKKYWFLYFFNFLFIYEFFFF